MRVGVARGGAVLERVTCTWQQEKRRQDVNANGI